MNKNICTVCGLEQFILNYKCINCGNILRDKVSNINLGEILRDLLFNLDISIKKILFAEHKNYLIVFSILLSFKLSIITLIYISFLDLDPEFKNFLFLLKLLTYWLIFLFFLSFLYKLLFRFFFNIKMNFRTVHSMIIFSFLYFALSFLIFSPLEFMLFGMYFFSRNPSIFIINLGKALMISLLEVIILIYTFYLTFNFQVFILHKKNISLIITVSIFFLIFLGNEFFKTIIGIK